MSKSDVEEEESCNEDEIELNIQFDNNGSGDEDDGIMQSATCHTAGVANDPDEWTGEVKQRLIAEYVEVVRQINNQNQIVNTLKMNIVDRTLKPCKNRCDEKQLKNLSSILQRENMKLQSLLRKAVTLQEEDPNQTWEHIPLATTFEEDSMPFQFSAAQPGKCSSPCSMPCSSSAKCHCDDRGDSMKNRKVEKLLKKLFVGMELGRKSSKHKQNVRKLAKILKHCQESESDVIFQDEHDCKTKKKKKTTPGRIQKMNKEQFSSYDMHKRLAEDNRQLEGDRYELQQEMLQRDYTIDCLQKKINLLQSELQCLCREKVKSLSNQSCKCQAAESKQLQTLQHNIEAMENCMDKLRLEMNYLQNEKAQWEATIAAQAEQAKCSVHDKCDDGCKEYPKKITDEMMELKENYACLLAEFAKKDAELKRLQAESQARTAKCDEAKERTEQQLIRDKLQHLQDENDELKCLIKEQAQQLAEYQNKYLAAQQKVEQQKSLLNRAEINNKKIEDQIDLEIRRIKEKFQDKLKELLPLPKLLENEQLKLAAACKENENLESKLKLVCRELKAIKVAAESNKQQVSPECKNHIKSLEDQVASLGKAIEVLEGEKKLLCNQLSKTKADLDLLRAESVKIVCRTKERADQARCALQQRLDCVEKELAQSRATACLSISDREDVIREMQEQLNTIACNFESAKNQIKTLNSHIAQLSADRPVVKDCY